MAMKVLQVVYYELQISSRVKKCIHQVHSLVFCLLKQCMDPPGVPPHQPKTPQVAQGTAYHSWHAGDGLEEQDTLGFS